MIHFQEAIQAIFDRFHQISSQNIGLIGLEDSLFHVVAEDLIAPMDVPHFDNSAMDGYAIRWSENAARTFVIRGNIQAGDQQLPEVLPGDTYRIFTGAPIPKGCNTIIQKEWATESNEIMIIGDSYTIEQNLHIRKKGSQSQKGSIFLKKGTLINPEIIGLIASFGITNFNVFLAPTIGIINTGNEIIQPGEVLKPGQIFNSNQYALSALCRSLHLKAEVFPSCKDELAEIQQTIANSVQNNPITLITGGISVGDFDFVSKALENLGIEKLFYKVKQKPGKPIFIGTKNNHWIIALPGNPAAVISCFHVYVKTIIRLITGEEYGIIQPNWENVFTHWATLQNPEGFTKKPGLTHFLKGYFKNGEVQLLKGQESFNLSSFNQANCLIIMEEDKETIKKGDIVKIIPFQ